MYQYKGDTSGKAMPYYDCISPAFLHGHQLVSGADELIGDFTHPDYKQIDESDLHTFLRRSLEAIKLEKLKRERNPPELDGASPVPGTDLPISFKYDLNHFKTGDFSNRLIVLDFDKFLTHPKHFVVGFFSNKKQGLDDNSRVVKKVWDLDDRLVAALSKFPCIHAYITCKKDNGEYFNFVFLDNEKAIAKWRAFKVHDAAVVISPSYYEWVRLNHAVLPCSIESILYKEGGEKRLEIIRSKYFLYHNGDCIWRGLRKHKCDDVFYSLPEHQPIRPFVFASFLGDNAFRFYEKLVEYIGSATGLPVKMIDVAALTKDQDPRPNDFVSIQKYNIDFAFTCGLIYVKFFPNLVALAAPVRKEERYNGNAVYFADIIVNSSSTYQTIEDLKGKVFCINEEISYTGCTVPEYHFINHGGLQGYFSKIERSGSHASSMDYIRDGKADAAAIDSVVFDMELSQRPERRKEFRVLESTRASPMPPFAASTWVPLHVQKTVQRALLNAHKHHPHLLTNNGFTQFVEVNDDKYSDIREVITIVENMRDTKRSAHA